MLEILENPGILAILLLAIVLVVLLCTGYQKGAPDTPSHLRPSQEDLSSARRPSSCPPGPAGPAEPKADRHRRKDVQRRSHRRLYQHPGGCGRQRQDLERARQAGPGGENFLNQDTPYIAGIAREVLEGNMREIVGRCSLRKWSPTGRSLPTWSRKTPNRTWPPWGLTSSASTCRTLPTATA